MTRAVKAASDQLTGLPVWAKVVGVVGLPGALCFALIYMMFAREANAAALPVAIHAVEVKVDAQSDRLEQMNQVRNGQLDTRIRLARLQCVAMQKTEQGRAECLK